MYTPALNLQRIDGGHPSLMARPWLDRPRPGARRFDFWVTLAVVAYSGNPALGRIAPIEPQWVLLAGALLVLLAKRYPPTILLGYVAVAGLYATLFAIQALDFGMFPITTVAGFLVRLFIGFAWCLVVRDPPASLIRVMVVLARWSLVIYGVSVLMRFAGIHCEGLITGTARMLGTLSAGRRPLVIHTFDARPSWRNFGMFWEPGAFQGYLNVALMVLAALKHRWPRDRYRRDLLILVAAVLSTLSTTGYVVLVAVLLMHVPWRWRGLERMRPVFRRLVVGVPVAIVLVGVGFARLPFLGQKITAQIERVQRQQGRWHRGRFGSLLFDWQYVRRRPLTGWGLHSRTRYALDPRMADSEGMGNGFSDFLAKTGLVGFLTWIALAMRSLRRLNRGRWGPSLLMMGVLFLELQGECFLAYPLFWALAFMAVAAGQRYPRPVRVPGWTPAC